MNKLAQNSPQSLFSHPGTVVPAHGTSSQPSSLVQQSQGQQLHPQPPTNMQNFYTNRQTIPRQMQSITRPGSVGVMGQAPTGARQFPNQITNVMYAPPPFGGAIPGGQTAVFMTSQPLPVSYRQQYTPAHQFPVPATQPRYVPSSTSAYNYPQAAPQQATQTLFYPPLSIQPSPIPQIPPANVNTGAKKKNIIRIEDPVTGKDVTDEVLSSSSSAKETHPQQSEIVAQFAAQVAAVATLTGSNKQASKSNTVPQMHGSEDEQTMNSPEMLPQSRNVIPSQSVLEPSISVNEVDNPSPPPPALPDVSLVASDIKDATTNPIENEPVYLKENVDDNSITSLEPAHGLISQVPTESDSLTTEKQEFEKRKDYESSGANFKITPQYSSETVPVSCIDNQNISESCIKHLVENVEISSPSLTVELSPNQDTFVSADAEQTVAAESISELDLHTQAKNGDAPNQVVSAVVPVVQEEKVIDTKENKKTKSRKKKELNKKGDSKEGGDMDAFLDKNEEIPVQAPLNSVPNSVPVPETVPLVESVPSQNGKVDDLKDDLKDMTDKETKNEINSIDVVDEVIKPTEDTTAITSMPKVQQITLKYNYKEDQWSPLNPEGKKQYDREFLLQLQSQPMSLRKPTNLPNLEVIKDSAIQHRLSDISKMPPPAVQAHNTRDLFQFDFNRPGGPRSFNTGIGRRQSQQGRDKPKKVITISTSLNHDVKLHESENAWKPSHKTGTEEDNDNPKTQELYKKVRGILNKLTPQKFQTLVLQVKQLEIETEERLKGVIDLVFEKAIDEPSFSVPYANMCKQLALLKVPVTGQENQCVNFRKLLLTKCQREFEKDYNDEARREERYKEIESAETEEKKKQLREELEDEERKTRRRSLGNIRFIGELFKLNMLIEPIMHDCVKKLLLQRDEDSLECLCRLLTTIGKELEGAEMSKNNNKKPLMDSYFNDMQKIVDKRQTSPRVRFMLQDVIELRHHTWVPRRDESNPKTIDQIHKEAEQEAREQQQMLQHAALQKRTDDRDRKKNRNNPPFPQTDGWSIARTKGNYNMDPSKFKLTKPTEAENIQLQPEIRGFSSWGRGSSGGVKTQVQEPELKLAMLNKFSALSEQGTPSHEMKWPSQRSVPSSRESSRGQSSQPLPLHVRKTPSQVKEREQLLETVKDLTRSAPPEPKPREVSNVEPKEDIHSRETGLVLKGVDLSEDEIEKKTKSLIDEFLHNSDFKEALQCVVELTSASTIHLFVSSSINQVLERSSQSRRLLGQLLCDLLKKKVITLEQYVKGLQAVLALADDYALDIPMIWNYLGEIIEPMIEDDGVPVNFLKDVAQPLIASCTAGKLVSEVLHAVAKNRGTIKVGEMWRDSGLSWSDFLGPSEDVEKFIATNKLEFTVSQTGMQPAVQLTPEDIKKQLDFLLQKKNADNEEIFDWIEANVGENRVKEPQFIRALVTAVVENAIQDGASCVLDHKKVKQRATLLQRYLDHKEHLELQALYALQSLMNLQNHPKGVLRHVFDILYDEDLISEDAFKQWEHSDDPAEQAGKGVALLSVGPFFTWLREADEESTDEN